MEYAVWQRGVPAGFVEAESEEEAARLCFLKYREPQMTRKGDCVSYYVLLRGVWESEAPEPYYLDEWNPEKDQQWKAFEARIPRHVFRCKIVYEVDNG